MSVREEIELMVQDMNPDALFMDDLDDAIIGIGPGKLWRWASSLGQV